MKKALIVFLLIIAIAPNFVFAGEIQTEGTEQAIKDQNFEAKVIEVLEEKKVTREDGSTAIQQNLKLKGLAGDFKGKEFVFSGIGDIEVMSAFQAKKGDKVVVSYSVGEDGAGTFYVTDFVRRGYLYLLAIVFSVVIVLIGKKQGFKSLISLILTFVVIMKYIVPKIVAGGNPLFVSIIGSVIILAVIIYLTWGFKLKAHIGLLSILLSLIITGLISILFTKLTELSGLSDENAMFLVGLSKTAINFKGLLLAGIVLGTVGVLDDVVISQISSVEQLSDANKSWKFKELYKSAMKVGVDHISSMTNTLFLAYAGASLPLLLLFNLNSGPFINFSQIINNEAIATEIVRTLTGSVGLMLAMPLSTLIAAKYYARKYKNIKT